MGNHHTEEILNLLNSWETLINLESGAISEGDIQKLGELVNRSTSILQSLETIFSSSGAVKHDKATQETMKRLYEQQDKNIRVLQEHTDELRQSIGELRKNKSSIKGYKQNQATHTRFKNERI